MGFSRQELNAGLVRWDQLTPPTGRAFRSLEYKALFGVGPDEEFQLGTDRVPIYVHPDDRALHRHVNRQSRDPYGSGTKDVEYRIAQEAITNAVKHGGAKRVVIRLKEAARKAGRFPSLKPRPRQKKMRPFLRNRETSAARRLCKGHMITAASTPSLLPVLPEAVVPIRSPRTSIILAELARQRRLERRQRRVKRRARRRVWARWSGWLGALGHWPFEPIGAAAVPGLVFVGAMPLVFALQP